MLVDEPRPLDASRLASEFRDRVHEDARQRDCAAEGAHERLKEAEARIGFLDRLGERLGMQMAAIRDRDRAQEEVDRMNLARPDRREVDAGLSRADRSARFAAKDRQRERERFEQRPDVQAARLEAHGNRLVWDAIAGGDKQITALAAHDLPTARAELLRREEEVRLQLEAEAREQLHQHQAHVWKTGASAPAVYSGPWTR